MYINLYKYVYKKINSAEGNIKETNATWLMIFHRSFFGNKHDGLQTRTQNEWSGGPSLI